MSLSALSLLLPSPTLVPVQDPPPPAARIVIQPPSLELQIGETATLEASVIGADGQTLDEEVFFFSRARRSVTVDREGKVEAVEILQGNEVFHEAATTAAWKWTFTPAIQNDKPVKVWVALPFRFQLN